MRSGFSGSLFQGSATCASHRPDEIASSVRLIQSCRIVSSAKVAGRSDISHINRVRLSSGDTICLATIVSASRCSFMKNGVPIAHPMPASKEPAVADTEFICNCACSSSRLRNVALSSRARAERPCRRLCQNKPPCLTESWKLTSVTCPILYPSATSKPVVRSSNLQLCCM